MSSLLHPARWIAARWSQGHWIDPARLAAQSTAAAALSYLVMTGYDLPHASWAVISALLVGQRSVDGTLAAVRGRIAATLVGAAVGLALVALLDGEGATLLRLVLGAAVVSAIAGFRPELRYGVVVVAIICLQPGLDPIEGAWERTVSVIVGAAAGGACAVAVWPQSAARRTQRSLRRVLVDCADLLDASLRRVLGDEASVDPLHRRYLQHIGTARDQAHTVRHTQRHQHMQELVHAIERLWHALIMLDRLTRPDARWSPAPGSPLATQVQAVRKHACSMVRTLAQSLGDTPPGGGALRKSTRSSDPAAGNETSSREPMVDNAAPSRDAAPGRAPPSRHAALDEALQQARTLALQVNTRTDPDNPARGGEAAALAFALGELGDNLEEIRNACAAPAA